MCFLKMSSVSIYTLLIFPLDFALLLRTTIFSREKQKIGKSFTSSYLAALTVFSFTFHSEAPNLKLNYRIIKS